MRDLPAAVRAKAVEAGAQNWLDTLPALIDDLATRWRLTIGPQFGDGTEAYVAAVTQADGTPAVLKLGIPHPGNAAHHETLVLRLTAGASCARLLQSDATHGALLMERLGPSMADLAVAFNDRLPILTDLAQTVWRSSRLPGAEPEKPSAASVIAGATPHISPLPTGAEKAAWLSTFIRRRWLELGKPCSEAAVEQAVAAAESRRNAHDPARAVLVHGDIHQWNALRTLDGAGYKLVDPDGLRAEPEYDLGVLMREDPVELMAGNPRDRARWLATRTNTDPQAIWEWGLAERVSTGLVLTAVDVQPVATQMLAAADQIAGS